MIAIRILFDPEDYKRILVAIFRVHSKTLFCSDRIGREMGLDYVRLLSEAIITDRYSGGYGKYSEAYEKWKSAVSPGSPFWFLTGDLLQSLTVWQESGGWRGGIPPGILDSGGKNYTRKGPSKYIAAYARIIEFGGIFEGQTHPARSLFAPVLKEYKLGGALKRVEEAKASIRRSWR